LSRATIARSDAFSALESLKDAFDLVLVDCPSAAARATHGGEDDFVRLVRQCVRHTRHDGHLIVTGYHPPLPPGIGELDERVALACEREGRVAFRVARPGLPFDFPTVIGSPGAEYMSAVALEIS
jgi:23S rRNA (cytosine1962-C5)-methyltransferase